MESQVIDDKIRLKKTELQTTDSAELQQRIQKQLEVLNIKRQIEQLKQRIKQIEAS